MNIEHHGGNLTSYSNTYEIISRASGRAKERGIPLDREGPGDNRPAEVLKIPEQFIGRGLRKSYMLRHVKDNKTTGNIKNVKFYPGHRTLIPSERGNIQVLQEGFHMLGSWIILAKAMVIMNAGVMPNFPTASDVRVSKGTVRLASQTNMGALALVQTVNQLPVDKVCLNDMLTHLLHKSHIGLRSIMVPACYLKQVSTIKRSGLISSSISLVIANHVIISSNSGIDVLGFSMTLDPRNFDGSEALGLDSFAKMGPKVTIAGELPVSPVLGVFAFRQELQKGIRFIHESFTVRAYVNRAVSTYGNDASSNFGPG